ncbi:hypothetical protein FOPG_19164 [Fusarium oxysporum f. sp. conglutinans race 2 54008]|uniref:Uncharacterized protein n=1 Tax=Fusarium oxysporum f. sp. conglutinans race 2 54008 TaxID=1089457 RepID=X0HTS1_FUSOX|nr:hypothetical protein FOPG_19164 [Fusarium oxysporum f. sp. conglutinans race 2 54008]
MPLKAASTETKAHKDISEPKSFCLVCQKRRSSRHHLHASDVLDRLICSRHRCAKIKLSLYEELSRSAILNDDNDFSHRRQPYGIRELPTDNVASCTKGRIAELPGDSAIDSHVLWADMMEDKAPVVNLDSKPRRERYVIH